MMLVRVGNEPQRYAWGERGAITEVFGEATLADPNSALIDAMAHGDEQPIQAELWLGAHPSSPSRILAGAPAGDLAQWITDDAAAALGPFAGGLRVGDAPGLPFLMKVLAAGSPLSLQVHPDLAAARAGFDREEAAGIAIDDPRRNFKDRGHKPELLMALTPMSALVGFTDLSRMRDLVAEIDPEASTEFSRRVRALRNGADVRELVAWVLRATAPLAEALTALDAWLARDDDRTEARNLRQIRAQYPSDNGSLLALLMVHVDLAPGEAIAVGAGQLHAYLRGTGIEVMATSDNVLRGGLTAKHIDVDELLAVLDAHPGRDPRIQPRPAGDHVMVYRPDSPDFQLRRAQGDADVPLHGPAIALALSGMSRIGTHELRAGQAVYVTDMPVLELRGDADVVIASSGLDADTPLPLPAA